MRNVAENKGCLFLSYFMIHLDVLESHCLTLGELGSTIWNNCIFQLIYVSLGAVFSAVAGSVALGSSATFEHCILSEIYIFQTFLPFSLCFLKIQLTMKIAKIYRNSCISNA